MGLTDMVRLMNEMFLSDIARRVGYVTRDNHGVDMNRFRRIFTCHSRVKGIVRSGVEVSMSRIGFLLLSGGGIGR